MPEGFYSFDYLQMDVLIANVVVSGRKVYVTNYSKGLMNCSFEYREEITFKDLNDLYKERLKVFRVGLLSEKLLNRLQSCSYLDIIKETHGINLRVYF